MLYPAASNVFVTVEIAEAFSTNRVAPCIPKLKIFDTAEALEKSHQRLVFKDSLYTWVADDSTSFTFVRYGVGGDWGIYSHLEVFEDAPNRLKISQPMLYCGDVYD